MGQQQSKKQQLKKQLQAQQLMEQQKRKKYSSILLLSSNIPINELRQKFSQVDRQTVRHIKIWNMKMEDQLVDLLLQYKLNTFLEIVNIEGNGIGVAGVKKIVENQWPTMKDLNIGRNNIGDEGLFIVLNRTPIQVEYLRLNGNGINLNRLKFPLVMQPGSLGNVKELDLGKNNLGVRAVQFITKTSLPKLQILNLRYCMTLTDDSIKYLSKGEWPNLTKLYLRILKVKIRLSENNPLFPDSFSDSQLEIKCAIHIITKQTFNSLFFSCRAIIAPSERELSMKVDYRVDARGREILSNANVKTHY